MTALFTVLNYEGRPKIPKLLKLKKRKNRFLYKQSKQLSPVCMLYEYGRGDRLIHVVAYIHEEKDYSEMVFLIEENDLTAEFLNHLNEPYYEVSRELYLDLTNNDDILQKVKELFADEAYPDENDFLHIYGQRYWHDDGYIIGDKASLTKLKAAIEVALEYEEAKTTMFPSDGEGYDLYIKCMDQGEDWDALAAPYHEDVPYFKEKKETHPKNFFKKHKRFL